MARAVLADHVLFSECMFYLREDLHLQNRRSPTIKNKKTFSCIATTFRITKIWDLGSFSISPSHKVPFPHCRESLISFVENPTWISDEGFEHPGLFGESLSCLISFISLLPVKSPRDSYFCNIDSLDSIPKICIDKVALTLPFISAGTGTHRSRLTNDDEDKLINELKELVSILSSIDKDCYSVSIQAIRLIHLSILVKRDDFGLAYLLLISAIEAVAGFAISRNKVKEKHSQEAEWGKIANQEGEFNSEFKELLKAYKDARGSQNYLQKRFTNFILEYCPPKDWEELVVSRYKNYYQEWNDSMQGSKHPSLMETEEIKKIFKKAYDERSKFVHQGIQPPHSSPEPYMNKFFEINRNYEGHLLKKTLSPAYGLMLAIAKHSIIRWLRTKV